MSNAVSETGVQPAGLPTLGWALRRALLGLTIMVFGVACAACLLYFAIDGDEARAGTPAPAAIQSPGSFLYKLNQAAQ